MTPRVVLDVNVLVSSLLGPLGLSRQILVAWRAERFLHCTSEHIISRMIATLSSPELRRRFPDVGPDLRALDALLRTAATIVPIPPAAVVPVTGDPEDDTVLATARLCQADYLVTGDRGLLAMHQYEGVTILTPRQFIDVLNQP